MRVLITFFALASVVIADFLSLTERLSEIASSIDTTLDYILLAPVKAGELVEFAAGLLPKSPLTTPVYSSDSTAALLTSSTQQITWAIYEITGLTNFVGYESNGIFVYATYNSTKRASSYGYRAADPAYCNSTTSTLPGDVKYPALLNCLQEYYVDSDGSPTYSYVGYSYDPRLRPWYISAKSSGKDAWSPVYRYFSGELGVTYTIPLFSPSNVFEGVLGFDYNLTAVSEILAQVTVTEDVVSYVAVASDFGLIATSTGESLSNSTSKYPKPATSALNTIIRESSKYLKNSLITADGLYSYTGSDGNTYYIQVAHFIDPTSTLDWMIVVVGLSNSALASNYGDAQLVIDLIAADLTAGSCRTL